MELWEDLKGLGSLYRPCIIGEDFNVILYGEEKLGGLELTQQEAIDFAQCISACALTEVRFSRSK